MIDPKEIYSSKIFEKIKEIVVSLIIVGIFVIPFRIFVAEPYLVNGKSMDPTFETRDYLIVDKLSEKAKHPLRNSVVVFKYPENPSRNFIKRIIGLPGETVVVTRDSVKIINDENPNGFTIEQPYLVHKADLDVTKKLGEDEYFVMGDNRADSFDSRYWGPLNRKFILGRPVIQLWPLNEIGIMPGNN